MTDAEKALEALDSGDISWQMWLFEHSDIIRRALKIAHVVDTWPTSSGSTWNEAATDTIERLRGIK